MNKDDPMRTWIEGIKGRGWQGAAQSILDVIEPIAPLVAQVLLVFQPISGVMGGDKVVTTLVEALHTPEGIAQLRQQLSDDEE